MSEQQPPRLSTVSALGAAMRDLSRAVVETEAPTETLEAVRRAVAELTPLLDAHRRDAWAVPSTDDLAANSRVFSPTRGAGSPISPPLTFEVTPTVSTARGVFDRRFEGPPGHVHGGAIALCFDELLGMVPIAMDRWGMTAKLEVSYLRPVSLSLPVEFTGAVVEAAGRKTIVRGTLTAISSPGEILARAEAVFVAPSDERQQEYFTHVTSADGAPTSAVYGNHAGLSGSEPTTSNPAPRSSP